VAVSILDKLARIRGVTWQWNDKAADVGLAPGTYDAGVVAQEVEAVFPELIVTSPEGYKKVNYTGLIGVLVEAVKELKSRNEALEKRVSELEKALAARDQGPPSAGESTVLP
jgi:endosialidase-like protein